MRLTRILPATLVVLALSACGGGAAPTATDPDLRPRMSTEGEMGSGTRSEGGIMSTGTGPAPVFPDTTQNGTNRGGGFIGSGG